MFQRFVGIAACIVVVTKLSSNGSIQILSHYGGGGSYETSKQHPKTMRRPDNGCGGSYETSKHPKLFVTLFNGTAVPTKRRNSIQNCHPDYGGDGSYETSKQHPKTLSPWLQRRRFLRNVEATSKNYLSPCLWGRRFLRNVETVSKIHVTMFMWTAVRKKRRNTHWPTRGVRARKTLISLTQVAAAWELRRTCWPVQQTWTKFCQWGVTGARVKEVRYNSIWGQLQRWLAFLYSRIFSLFCRTLSQERILTKLRVRVLNMFWLQQHWRSVCLNHWSLDSSKNLRGTSEF